MGLMLADGGTYVTVTGINFVDTPLLRCKFDQLLINATFVDTSTAICISPPHPVGNVSVEITNNNQDYTSDNVQFRYYRM